MSLKAGERDLRPLHMLKRAATPQIQVGQPARAGDLLEIYAMGLGALEPAPADGEAGGGAVLRHASAAVRVWLGSQPLAAEDVLFAGGAPSLVGVNVILARVPAGIAPNDALEVQLEVGGARSQPGVTIAVE